jgi:hypothetical protein
VLLIGLAGVGLYTLLGVMVIVVAPPGVVVTLVAVGVGALLVIVVVAPGVVTKEGAAGAVPTVMPLFGSTVTFAVLVTVLAVLVAGVAVVTRAALGAVGAVTGLLTLCPVPWKNVSSSSS